MSITVRNTITLHLSSAIGQLHWLSTCPSVSFYTPAAIALKYTYSWYAIVTSQNVGNQLSLTFGSAP